jgi:pimeloyl-ACP methyl ester carboxylesterase
MALDALSLLDELGWKEEVHLVGLSMGGMVTQELALLDLSRFSSLALLSTIAGGMGSLGLFVLSIPTGIYTLANTFLSSNPQQRLANGLKILYPEEFLKGVGVNPESGQMEPNLLRFRRALIDRGKKRLAAGVPALPLSTVFKQALAVATHHVSKPRLQTIGGHFGAGVLVVTGDADILVHQKNSAILADGLMADSASGSGELLVLPCAVHGANEQCEAEVCAAIHSNIERGQRHREQQSGLPSLSRL